MAINEISAAEAFQIMKNGDVGLIDVREPAEHSSAHISGSKLHPLGTINETAINLEKKAHIIYCQKGGRGKNACEKLLSQNPNLSLFNISGGIES